MKFNKFTILLNIIFVVIKFCRDKYSFSAVTYYVTFFTNKRSSTYIIVVIIDGVWFILHYLESLEHDNEIF